MMKKAIEDRKEQTIDRCWLRYNRLSSAGLIEEYKKWCAGIVLQEDSPVCLNALEELKKGIREMLGIRPRVTRSALQGAHILLGTLEGNPSLPALLGMDPKASVGEDGFAIRFVGTANRKILVVAGRNGKGLLYGVFCLLRAMQTQTEPGDLPRTEGPANKLRMVNHWDNMDGSVERGYAGRSLFFSGNKLLRNHGRIREYARLLASVGINGVVINNVNVHKFETRLISGEFLGPVSKLADVFRPYGIRLFLSANYASPMELGGLATADPLDEGVRQWWKDKAAEIYRAIPDFGGFLIKADSEFRPGPFTYGRSHADGANMLAEALADHGGLVIWRCFVYNCLQDWRDRAVDRAKAAYGNFMPLDGRFRDNVLLQIKNGPMDFQVREPVSPLIGGLRKTNFTLELQITQEYTGQQKHLCYLVPMWKEVLDFDTFARGKGSTVKEIVSGRVFRNEPGGFAAVVNVGNDPNWTGFQLAQANLYGYGRLAWDPCLPAEQITDEWVRMTFSNDQAVTDTISGMLLESWRIYENYNAPLGIGWMVNPNHHFGPNVDGYEYAKWGTYHRADSKGIGVDRSVASGTGFAGQYHKEVAQAYEKIETCPEELLLFFHRVPYDYVLKSGETLIQHIYDTHFEGVEQVQSFIDRWLGLKGQVDGALFEHVLERLEGQLEHAKEWRDVINSYFYRKTGIADRKGRKIY
jgi:alpha-glucuronidase